MIDIRALLPRADWSIGSAAKASVTVHWNGPAVDYGADPLEVAKADAQFHIDKDWSDMPGLIVHGDGIMYHRLYAPDGRVFMTRDPDAILWHAGHEGANIHSSAWQVMTGKDQHPTSAQLASLARDLEDHIHFGHRDWSPTECPGDELYAFITRAKEEPVEDDEFIEKTLRLITPTLVAMKEAYDPLVVWARENGKLDEEQEMAIARIDNVLGPDGVKLIVETQLGVKDDALKPKP